MYCGCIEAAIEEPFEEMPGTPKKAIVEPKSQEAAEQQGRGVYKQYINIRIEFPQSL